MAGSTILVSICLVVCMSVSFARYSPYRRMMDRYKFRDSPYRRMMDTYKFREPDAFDEDVAPELGGVCTQYQSVGRGLTCETNVYTNVRSKCDGWAKVGPYECQAKCDRNDVPAGCPRKECKYVVWDDNPDWHPGWCQLATEGCRIGKANKGHYLFMKKTDGCSKYTLVGRSIYCKADVYTRVKGKCDGWARVGLEECQRKCDRNDVPAGCPSKKCNYAVWDDNPGWQPGWCQLATGGCSNSAAFKKQCVRATYKLVGQGKSCETNVYTRVAGKCDGWARVGLEDCQRKCDRNDVPAGCPKKKCKYVVWDDNPGWQPGWCQLATEGCRIGAANKGNRLYEKTC